MNDNDDSDDSGVNALLAAFKDMLPVSVEPIFEDGFYKGAIAVYKNGMTLYHPYVPLTTTGVVEGGEMTDPMGLYPTREEYEAGVAPGGLSTKTRYH